MFIHSLKVLFRLLLAYFFLYIVVLVFAISIVQSHNIELQVISIDVAKKILPLVIFWFIIIFVPVLYLFNSILARRKINITIGTLLLYMGICGFLGPLCEITINTISRLLFSVSIWEYKFLPLHEGDTSLIMFLLWPLYGFHAYFFHKAIAERFFIKKDMTIAILVGVDAILLEVIVNIFSLLTFGTFIFYYNPQDLQHFSTGIIFVPYVIFGYGVLKIIQFLDKYNTQKVKVLLGLALLVFTTVTSMSIVL